MQISTLALVSLGSANLFRDSMIVNSPSTSGSTMHHRELRSIKSKAFTADLSFIHDSFYKEVQTQFGSSMAMAEDSICMFMDPGVLAEAQDEMGDCALPSVIGHHFGTKAKFCAEVELAYKKFMIIKAIETSHSELDTHDTARDGGKRWAVRCQPACIVDAFWHSHMLLTKRFGALPAE